MVENNRGGIQTFTGKIISPIWPDPDMIDIRDIAHGLSQMPRFAGQARVIYVVGQHCIIGSRWFRKQGMLREARWYLLHEGAEGLGMMDMPHPIKYLDEMSAYKALEKNMQYAVYRKFGLYGEPPPAIKELDNRMCAAEAKVLMRPIPDYATTVDTSDLVIKPYKRLQDAEKYYLKEFNILFG